MGVIFWLAIASLYALSLIPFVLARDWSSTLISLGCVLVLIGNILAAADGRWH